MVQISKLKSKDDEFFSDLVARSDSIKEVGYALGYRGNSGVIFYQIRDRINSLGLDTTHFGIKSKLASAEKSAKFSLDEIMVENSSYTNISRLKIRIVNSGILQYVCDECGLSGLWNGIPITLQLDHRNGIPSDHRIENLRFLCPNCHSQTNNFSGRNKVRNL